LTRDDCLTDLELLALSREPLVLLPPSLHFVALLLRPLLVAKLKLLLLGGQRSVCAIEQDLSRLRDAATTVVMLDGGATWGHGTRQF
jgi:hypothetical protein